MVTMGSKFKVLSTKSNVFRFNVWDTAEQEKDLCVITSRAGVIIFKVTPRSVHELPNWHCNLERLREQGCR